MLKTILGIRQSIRDYFEPKGIILMYHRVAEVRPDPWSLCVSPRHFEQHLQVINKICRPINLNQFSNRLSKGKLPRRWVSITLDDGYADNFINAKPLLERYDTPATFFVTADIIGNQKEYWWDELEKIFLEPFSLPEELQLNINGTTHQWVLGASAAYLPKDFENDKNWIVESQNDPTNRHSVYRELHRLILQLPVNQIKQVMDEIVGWAGVSREVRSSYRPMSGDEISVLGKMDLIEVGSHSLTHSNLAALDINQQKHEIVQSKAVFENLLGRTISSFSYPFGSFSSETVDIVREAGFRSAVSVQQGIVHCQIDVFRLPRIPVQDMDGELFNKILAELME
jgi:peptidoglycan/xylan/chitin deacetylase (PgdA/CDA1 family)